MKVTFGGWGLWPKELRALTIIVLGRGHDREFSTPCAYRYHLFDEVIS